MIRRRTCIGLYSSSLAASTLACLSVCLSSSFVHSVYRTVRFVCTASTQVMGLPALEQVAWSDGCRDTTTLTPCLVCLCVGLSVCVCVWGGGGGGGGVCVKMTSSLTVICWLTHCTMHRGN